MEALITSGRIVDAILLLVGLEVLLLVGLWRWRRLGVPPRDWLVNLASGVALLLATRAALTGAEWYGVAAWLLVAFGAHLLDLALRWRPPEDPGT